MKTLCSLILFMAIYAGDLKAQHCRYDGSVVLVLDIRSKEDHQPIANLDVKLAGPDRLEYYRNSWSYTPETKYPSYISDYMRFTYVTEEMIKEVAKETDREIPQSLLHKYILWLGPEAYRNAFSINLNKKRYLEDQAMINIKKDGLINGVQWITFSEHILWRGCTSSEIWQGTAKFQTVYFSKEQVADFEKLR